MLSPELIGVLGLLAMFIGLALGIHIGVTLGVLGFAGCVAILGFQKSYSVLVTTPFVTASTYSFIVLPMFILMGEFAFQGGVGRLLFTAASKWLGRLHGGLAMASCAAAALFAAITGSSLATAATFGKVATPEMMRLNYDGKLAAGSVAAAGSLAALIPPSGLMVLYCIFTDVSLGKLFIAGFIPGAISALIYMGMIYIRVRINPSLGPPSDEVVSWKEKISSVRWLTPLVIVVIVMLGGIYGGIFSPVEAGSIGAFVVFVVVLARRSLPLKALKTALENAARTTAMIFFIIIGAMIFGKFLTLSGLPDALMMFIESLAVPRIYILILILIIYVILGAIMDVQAMICITLPIFFPLLSGLGFDGVWLGILTIKIIEIGVITPPIGLNVYVVKGVLGDTISLSDLFKGILPFFYMDVLTLAILVAFPQISLWLPSKMF
jgi:tripartite ATP-independent transporter DctM subunit